MSKRAAIVLPKTDRPGGRARHARWARWVLGTVVLILSMMVVPGTTVRAALGTTWTVRTPGLPILYVIPLSGHGTLQCYLDPGLPGFNGVHVTFFDAAGRELTLDDGPVLVRVFGDRGASTLPVLREGPGHVYTDFVFRPGAWRLEITAKTATGNILHSELILHLQTPIGTP